MQTYNTKSRARCTQRLYFCNFLLTSSNFYNFLFFADGADGIPVEPIAAAPDVIDRTEVQSTRVVRVARIERRTPIEAVRASIVERIVAIARSGQENAVAVRTGNFITSNVVPSRIFTCNPLPSTFSSQFILFCFCRHTPISTPISTSGIVFGFKSGFIIYCAIITISIVFGYIIIFNNHTKFVLYSTPFIILFIINLFGFRFTPSKIVAIIYWFCCAHITCCSKRSAWQT